MEDDDQPFIDDRNVDDDSFCVWHACRNVLISLPYYRRPELRNSFSPLTCSDDGSYSRIIPRQPAEDFRVEVQKVPSQRRGRLTSVENLLLQPLYIVSIHSFPN